MNKVEQHEHSNDKYYTSVFRDIYIYIYIDYRYVDATNKSMSKYSSNGIFHLKKVE